MDHKFTTELEMELLDMLQYWSDWKLCFEPALGIEHEPPKEAPRQPQQGEHLTDWRNPIDEFNQSRRVADVLLHNGYKQKGKDRFIRPGSESKAPGIAIMRNCADGIDNSESKAIDAWTFITPSVSPSVASYSASWQR